MIPDLLHHSKIRRFIFDNTGQWIPKYRIKKWLKSGKIESFKLPNNRRYTRKCLVRKFIKENSNG